MNLTPLLSLSLLTLSTSTTDALPLPFTRESLAAQKITLPSAYGLLSSHKLLGAAKKAEALRKSKLELEESRWRRNPNVVSLDGRAAHLSGVEDLVPAASLIPGSGEELVGQKRDGKVGMGIGLAWLCGMVEEDWLGRQEVQDGVEREGHFQQSQPTSIPGKGHSQHSALGSRRKIGGLRAPSA
ncbi:hypothetical protein BP6252_04123 [Coleophoma cylindrospora]|uniref:Uncharacterized protein n=1 Tax=Coleophoma cylindrospora TaxID=1849047 RepID=A0A3D8RZL9_9HELO|nr:hypothetical protein BP6252_04123 [Coleophoma cylindrospora]